MTKLEIFKRNTSYDTWRWIAKDNHKEVDGCFTLLKSRNKFQAWEFASAQAMENLGDHFVMVELKKL